MVKFSRHFLLVISLLLLALSAAGVMAQDNGVTDDEVNEIARDVYCPVCESTPLDVCQTQACADWRELIRTKLGEGQSKQEIFEYFARQYGDGVLANPPRRGVSLVVLWVLPVVVVLLGLLLFGRTMRSLRGTQPQPAGLPAEPGAGILQTTNKPAAAKPARDDYLARVEEELDYGDE
jgi:cytochrome c-type biogenesis protein CcmH